MISDAVIRVYDFGEAIISKDLNEKAGNAIETHEHAAISKSGERSQLSRLVALERKLLLRCRNARAG
jgi:hypothetical protein